MAVYQDEALIDQMNKLVVNPGCLAVWGLGQMGVALKTEKQMMIYIDPILSNVVAETFPNSAADFQRAFPTPVRADLVTNADVVLCTHEHLDHADPLTLGPICVASPRAVFIAPRWADEQLDQAGVPAERRIVPAMDQYLSVDSVRVWVVPAAHYSVECDSARGCRWLSYLIDTGGIYFFHSGDTILYPGYLERISALPKADLGMVAVNGRDAIREAKGIVGNLLPEEAARMSAQLGWDVLLSGHNDLFEMNTIPASQIADALARVNPRQKFHALQPGELYYYVR
jgi:L-ascorbate metabolism protein UlaG (beta-lactamase superfamily)